MSSFSAASLSSRTYAENGANADLAVPAAPGAGTPIGEELTPGLAVLAEPQQSLSPVALGGMQVLVLGSLEVRTQRGVELELPSAALVRAVFEVLALRAGTVVQTWELIDGVWGADPPATVTKSLQANIGALRRVLGFEAIQTVGRRGYRLRVEPEDVDINVFERHIAEGSIRLQRGDFLPAVERLSAALGLWRGEPLEELVDSQAGMMARARLSELRRAAEERLFEARLRLGQHEAVVADLQAAVRAEPFRERRWEQLMLALYRSGRQVDALGAFNRLLNILNQHRLSPGDPVLALKAAIADRDPNLALPAAGNFDRSDDGRAGAAATIAQRSGEVGDTLKLLEQPASGE